MLGGIFGRCCGRYGNLKVLVGDVVVTCFDGLGSASLVGCGLIGPSEDWQIDLRQGGESDSKLIYHNTRLDL